MSTVLTATKEKSKTREVVVDPDWCAGCGDFGVLKSLKSATTDNGVKPHELLLVSGIGCSSNLPGFFYSYAVHSLHGRALPVATGAKLANHNLKVVITGGDGDGYGIGIGHFIHTMRRNLDLTYIVMDNEIYGLTTGQASPTTAEGHKTKTTPRGNVEKPINPLALALTAGATFVARGFSGQPAQLTSLIEQAMAHKGFALIDVFSPCVTYNKLNTYSWFKERVYKLEDEEPDRDLTDFSSAMTKAMEFDSRIPIGLIYKIEKPTYEDTEPVLLNGPLIDQSLGIKKELFDELLAVTM
ncbi:2-oxoacid ferredoxin oxidoreductase [candidate division KSB1 bacterium]|nr:2-oxoacid ferredoxin oxidoreductase [candidate division KSB1 bacterium]MCH8980487.1 2-oxoacid ferredoxin oxidoreductase [candidate division KSB1 bacterium]